ncbi:unnamed protein product [Brugia pahangi]|uniref:Secreted protein n=1 Tax=Brugia pahangi TaxID=6280 RepID=A0A0N4TA27_BRUPA|nr:unnamed protein product [Brugia pahangi]
MILMMASTVSLLMVVTMTTVIKVTMTMTMTITMTRVNMMSKLLHCRITALNYRSNWSMFRD